MHAIVRVSVLITAAALLGGCATGGNRCALSPARQTEIGHEAHQAFVSAINTNDIDELFEVLTDDVVVMAPNEPRLVGKEAVRPWVEGYFAAYKTHWDKTTLEFVVRGDWAFEQYAYASTDTPRDGGPVVRDTGKGLAIFHRGTDGKWRVARDAWNSDLPSR